MVMSATSSFVFHLNWQTALIELHSSQACTALGHGQLSEANSQSGNLAAKHFASHKGLYTLPPRNMLQILPFKANTPVASFNTGESPVQ